MTRLERILEYKKNNPGCDPNLFEVVELTDELIKAEQKESEIEWPSEEIIKSREEEVEKYREVLSTNLFALRQNDLGVDDNCPLMKLMMWVKRNYINLEVSPCYYAKLVGVSLYIRQQQRAVRRGEQENVIFDNKDEFEFLRKELSIVRKRLLKNGITEELISYGITKIDDMPEFKLYDIIYDIYTASTSTKEVKYEP